MKRLLVVGLVTTSVIAAAQPAPPSAATVLANVENFYAGASHLTAKFRQVVTYAAYGTSKTSDGKLWVVKPSELRWDYLEKNRKLPTKSFVVEGATLWLVDHGNQQIFKNQTTGSVLPAAVSFLTGASTLSKDFDVALGTDPHATVIELTPKQPSAAYKRLRFVVDPRDWHITESFVIGANGDTNDFKFYTPDLATTIASSLFKVDPTSLPTYKLVIAKPASSP